jgi:type II secretory pathway pseudopilin PulG
MRPLPRTRAAAAPRRAAGLVLLALLIMLILVGVGALAAAEVWAVTLKRERETELLFIGDQYRRAIQSYWKMTPGRRAYPPSVDVLLTDNRFPMPVHHLRRQYRDPMVDSGEFEPIMQANSMIGIQSISTAAPLKHANFPAPYRQFENAESYAQWQFIFLPPGAQLQQPGMNPTQPVQPVMPGLGPSQGPAPGVPVPQSTGR